MGKILFCDTCGADAAIESSLHKIKVNDRVIGDVCLTCSSQLEQHIRKQISSVYSAKKVMPAKEDAKKNDVPADVPAGEAKNGNA